MDVVNLVLHRLNHVAGVPAAEHEDDPGDNLLFPVGDGGSMTHRGTDLHIRHVADIHGDTPDFLDHDILDVLDRLDQANAAHDVLFRAFLQDIAAGVRIVLGHGIEDIVQRQVVLSQQPRFHHDLILFDEPAHGIDVDDILKALHHRPDDPIHECPPLHELFHGHFIVGFFIARPFQIELIDLAEPGRVRHQLGDRARRQQFLDFEHPFKHHLPRQIDIDVVLKNDRNHGQADLGERPDIGQAGRPHQLEFNGKGDEPFDLFRRKSLHLGDNLHQHVGHVGKGINRNDSKRVESSRHQHTGEKDNQDPLANGKVKQGCQHPVTAALRGVPTSGQRRRPSRPSRLRGGHR